MRDLVAVVRANEILDFKRIESYFRFSKIALLYFPPATTDQNSLKNFRNFHFPNFVFTAEGPVIFHGKNFKELEMVDATKHETDLHGLGYTSYNIEETRDLLSMVSCKFIGQFDRQAIPEHFLENKENEKFKSLRFNRLPKKCGNNSDFLILVKTARSYLEQRRIFRGQLNIL